MGGRRAVRRLSNELPETAVVQDATAEGQGIASINGKRVFIDGALSGETVTLRRVRARRNYDEAELIEVIEASPDRAVPRCVYFGTCGGCSLQHLSSAAQVRLKETVLLESLKRIGFVTPGRVMPAVTGPPWGYRRRARLAARCVPGKGRVLVGFSEKGSPRITDMRSCETLHPAVSALLSPLSELIGALSLAQRIPQIEVAVADNATVLVFRMLEDPTSRDLDGLRCFRARHGVRVLLQRAGPNQITPLDPESDGGDLWYELVGPGLRMTFGPTDFVQVNADVNRQMITLALDLLSPGPATRLLDLFCGIGNFTLPLARHAAHVLGLEGDAAMVGRARLNAGLNGIANAEFRVADLGAAGSSSAWAGQRFDAVLLDPPRAGAAAILRPLAETGAARLVYVSCHPGTLARDAGTLVSELGYQLTAAGILDMFPATSHVESVAVFERR
jgi:23S rRNA (uracil1939-C5)-methyltransferase